MINNEPRHSILGQPPPRELRLVSDRPKGSDFESLPRLTPRPRYRQRRLDVAKEKPR
jgi:hypothetical protein